MTEHECICGRGWLWGAVCPVHPSVSVGVNGVRRPTLGDMLVQRDKFLTALVEICSLAHAAPDSRVALELIGQVIERLDKNGFDIAAESALESLARTGALDDLPQYGPESDTHEDRGYSPSCQHEWDINGCKKCGRPSMPRG